MFQVKSTFVVCLLACLSLGGFARAESAPATPLLLYVSTAGDDRHDGSTDHPLATLEGARDRIRDIKRTGLPKGGVTVLVGAGTYEISKSFELAIEDSGTAESPIVYRSAPGQTVVLTGGKAITNFSPYKGSILQADLAKSGLKGVAFTQLVFQGKRQILARYPNADPKNPSTGGWAYVDGKVVSIYQEIPGESKRTLIYKPQDAREWAHPEDAQIFVFPRYNWWNNIVPVASVDKEKRTITVGADPSYPMRAGDRYYVQGVMEELDSPGEWFLDRRTWTLYFWPPTPDGIQAAYAPVVRTIVRMKKGTRRVTLRGFVVECCEGNAIELDDAEECVIAGNTVRNVGDYNGSGIVIYNGHHNLAVGNDVSYVGRNAIVLLGGDRPTLLAADNNADNNYLHHFGIYYKQGVGVEVSGVGNQVTHNLIHDGPRFGILFSGNNLLIEKNHIRHVDLETEDTGAIYTGGRDWISSRGTIVRYNYFHDILGFGRNSNGKWVTPYFAWGIYLDDNTGGVDVYGNIVARATRAGIHLHNGRDNHIENNIFVDNGPQQFELNGWLSSDSGWKEHHPTMVKGYESVATQPAWKNMRNIDLGPDRSVLPNGMTMTGDEFHRNIFYWTDPAAKLAAFRRLPLDHFASDQNLVWHGGLQIVLKTDRKPDADETWDQWRATGFDNQSVVADPKFVDVKKDDYRLSADSPAWSLGFKAIPIDEIGPYASEFRASWPIVEAPGMRESMAGH